MGVQRGHVQLVAENGEPAVHGVATKGQVVGQFLLIVPELAPRLGVNGKRMVPRGGDVHDALDHQRRAFKSVEHSGLKGPFGHQIFDIRIVDFLKLAETRAAVIPGVHQPVVGVFTGFQQHLGADLGRNERRGNRKRNAAAIKTLIILLFIMDSLEVG